MPLTTVDQGLLSTNAQYTGFKNRIINGDMQIDQRNNGASVSVSAGTARRTVDMFSADISGGVDGVFTMQQSTTVPTTGFRNSVALTVTTANTSSNSGRYYRFIGAIEGFNIADLNSGSATAATVTLSFWVRSSITGTYCVGFQNAAFNRSYAANYTISAANTWEQKSITLTLDTTGTWASDNTAGLKIFWDLGSGSAFQQTANSWAASNTWLTSSQTNWINTNGATFQLTGVQLEKGQTATSFDVLPYGTELALCQRYCQVLRASTAGNNYARFGFGVGQSTTQVHANYNPPVTFRTAPSLTASGSFAVYDGVTVTSLTSINIDGDTTPFWVSYGCSTSGGLVSTRPYELVSNNTTASLIVLLSEL
jgi:hypothetical protein